jgi:DNA-binding transcriptional MocR family regulator
MPIYLQIVNQVKYLVASGRLAPGEELPPIRVLAEQLLVNPNTVARAYRELERAGVVLKRRTAGTYVNAMLPGWVRTAMGGPDVPRTVEAGADTAVWLADEAPHELTGRVFRGQAVIPW